MSEALFFGCWNRPGHFLVGPGGRSAGPEPWKAEHYGDGRHLDGSLAPKRREGTGELCCVAWCKTKEEEQRVLYRAHECPQGEFLRHELDNGYSSIQWWDRCQGDKRSACNSTILLPGSRTTEELLAALKTDFPSVLANLERAGIELTEVKR